MRTPRKDEAPPRLREVVEYIERRMAGKSGSVTLHFKSGNFEGVQWGDREDSRAMPRSA